MDQALAQVSEAQIAAEQLTAWAIEIVPNVITALVVLILGWIIAGWAGRAVRRLLMAVDNINPALPGFLARATRYALIIVTLVIVLGEFGVQTASILAVLGTAGLAIALALQGTLSNIAAGIMLLWLRPFQIDDYIEAGGISGTVTDIDLFATEFRTPEGLYRFVPNSRIWNNEITNYSRLKTRRLDVEVGIGYDDDIAKARDTLLALAREDKRILDDPEPQVLVSALGDSAVNVMLRCWTATGDHWPTRFETIEKAKLALDAAGITIPYPQRTVHQAKSG